MGKEVYKSKIGGQALIEGVMMKGVYKGAMACRLPDGTIDLETWDENNGSSAPWYKKTPFIRGSFNFVSSLVTGYRCLMKSAEKQMTEEDSEEEMTKFEKWLTEKLGENLMSILSGIAMVLGVAISLFLFKFIPTFCTKPLENVTVLRTAAEGILKIAIFIGYLAVTGMSKDIKRTYEYHGAEHKTIACLEAHEELTVANVKKQVRFHPRCGTSFIFITLFTSIFVFCFIPSFAEFGKAARIFLRLGIQLALLPFIIGIAYELIRLAGKKTNLFTKIISAPGLQIQRLTTREPDDSQIEVAIAAIKPCIPENQEEDVW
ncbi:DUF1385 domain-containing protein [Ruminococcus sp. HUN007]|uniref:DUF1385 domain-containing protein n=1 Tax=Ruminococcus sp. HUN007 TaxID=1514668 RepID=UPI0005D1C5FC|nr:DUF1385 domain-containing protein [Ruminococcus sp. HUN007]